jgi:hypothetical protein
MITIYAKNRSWGGEPRFDFIKVVSRDSISGYKIDASTLKAETMSAAYLQKYSGRYHPATSWEIEEFRKLGGSM